MLAAIDCVEIPTIDTAAAVVGGLGVNLPATSVYLQPAGVAVDAAGTVYISDRRSIVVKVGRVVVPARPPPVQVLQLLLHRAELTSLHSTSLLAARAQVSVRREEQF